MTLSRLAAAFPKCVLWDNPLTIISTASETITPLDKGEGSLDLELKSYPPVSDTISLWKQVDWDEVKERCRGGLNNVGLVLAIVGEKTHDVGVWLAEL